MKTATNFIFIALAFGLLNGCYSIEERSLPEAVEKKVASHIQAGRYNEALDSLRPYANKGIVDAQFSTAYVLLQRDGTNVDIRMVLDWLRKAGVQGDEASLQYLSDLYHWGWLNVPKDQKMAEMWANAIQNTNTIPECLRYERSIPRK